jgi:hypothetical protein
MIHARVLETDKGARSVPISVRDGATLTEALQAVGVAVNPARSLAQNGRPAKPNDPVKPNAFIAQQPRAGNG